ncbi:unnamed protein product [Effrenium voratum]|nr:unnamed protein product [Effrenium voratum]
MLDSFAWDEASKETRNFRTFEEMDKLLQEGAATVDAQEAAKKKRRAQSQHSLPSEASCLQRIVNHPWFDIFFAVVVVTNSVFVGVEVSSSVAGEEPLAIQVFQYAYTVIFTVELALRILANGRRFILSEEWMWNWMDIFIVLTSLWELAVELATTDETSGSSIQFTGLKALRLVRITRIVKVARLARVLRFVMALRTLISSIIYTLKSLIWAMVLLGLIVYVFAVLFTQAVGDALLFGEQLPLEQRQASERYFGTLEETMLSLFMCIAGGVSWEEVVRPLKAISTAWVFVFLFYIAFTYFAVLNVVTGVFCQSAIDSAQNDQAMVLQSIQANKQAHIEKIRNLFQAIDTEETGVITYKLLEESITSPVVQTFFEAVGLDVWDAWSFFKLLDLDAGGAVEIEEFLMGCLRLKGQAKSMDVVKVMHDQAWLISQQSRFWVYVESELQALKAQMGEAA